MPTTPEDSRASEMPEEPIIDAGPVPVAPPVATQPAAAPRVATPRPRFDTPGSGAPRVATPRPLAPRAGLPVRTTPPPASDRAPLDAARRVVELAEDKKAGDIVLLEIAPLTTVADYLVICTGGSERQLDAIADNVVTGLKQDGLAVLGREGEPDSHWILIDAGVVIVHIFAPPERDFYALEKLWAEAHTVLRIQ